MNDMRNVLLYLITNLFLVIAIMGFVKLFFNQSKCGLLGLAAFAVTFFIINSCLFLIFGNPFINLISNILFIYFATNLYKDTWQKRILATIATLSMSMLIDMIVYNLFTLVFIEKGESYITNAINVILIFMVTNILDKVFNYKEKHSISIFSWILILLVPFGSIVIVAIIYLAECSPLQNTIIVFMLLAINVAVFYLYNEIIKYALNQYEKELLALQNSAYIRQFDTIKASQNKIESLNHDIKNHMIALQCLLEKQNYKEISIRLKEILEYTQVANNWSKTGNIEFDSFLNYKISQIKNIGTAIECKISTLDIDGLDMFDMTVILGNLLDNSLEALIAVPEKIFKFAMEMERGIIYINVSNTYNQKLEKNQDSFATTKRDGNLHGLGLKNIESSIQKYGGTIEIDATNNFFNVNLMFYKQKL